MPARVESKPLWVLPVEPNNLLQVCSSPPPQATRTEQSAGKATSAGVAEPPVSARGCARSWGVRYARTDASCVATGCSQGASFIPNLALTVPVVASERPLHTLTERLANLCSSAPPLARSCAYALVPAFRIPNVGCARFSRLNPGV